MTDIPVPPVPADQALAELTRLARTPLSQWPIRYPGRQAMGYLCSYVPVEIIHAAGLTPVRVRGSTTPLRQVDAHLQPFACALCRSALDQLLCGELHFLAGTVLAHTCDTMQALADLWRIGLPGSRSDPAPAGLHVVMQPTNLGDPAAYPYLFAELGRFRDRLTALVGHPITDDDLRASIVLYDETRRLVGALQHQRARLRATDFFAILDAAQIMPREQFNPLLAGLLDTLEQAPAYQAGDAPLPSGLGLFLTGATLDDPILFELIQELGARVVGDDLCSGSRHFDGLVDSDSDLLARDGAGGSEGRKGDPIAALAAYFLRRSPCPAKLHPRHDPGHYLLNQVRAVRADGVLFVLAKFCDPHAFERALALPALDRAGVPHLLLDAPGADQSFSLEGVRTRLQAFVEILAQAHPCGDGAIACDFPADAA